MKYFIDGRETDKENFEEEFEKKLADYQRLSKYWPEKNMIKYYLIEKGQYSFFVKDESKRIAGMSKVTFTAVEDDVVKMAEIIAKHEFDDYDNDAFTIAMALYKAGCRFVSDRYCCNLGEEEC